MLGWQPVDCDTSGGQQSSQSWAQCGLDTGRISLIGLNTGTTSAQQLWPEEGRVSLASSMNGDGRIRDPILLWFDFCKFWFPHKICMNFYTEVKTGHKHHNHHQHGHSWATETKRWKIPKYIENSICVTDGSLNSTIKIPWLFHILCPHTLTLSFPIFSSLKQTFKGTHCPCFYSRFQVISK